MLDVAGVVYRRFLWVGVVAAGLGGPVAAQTAVRTPVAGAHEASFDVAVIRPVAEQNGRRWYGSRMLPSGRFEVSSMALQSLIYQAYVQDSGGASRVTGAPKWADSDQFDINATLSESDSAGLDKLSDDARRELVRPALRKLLEERFHVKVHIETRVEPVYAMVQAKGGAKLKEVPLPAPLDPSEMDAFLRGRGPQNTRPPGSFFVTGSEWTATAVKMRNIKGQLAYFCKLTDRPIVDATGLTGVYDFKVTFATEPDAPTKEQQIEEQLGLRMESRKAPITVYVVDAAEKPTLDGTE